MPDMLERQDVSFRRDRLAPALQPQEQFVLRCLRRVLHQAIQEIRQRRQVSAGAQHREETVDHDAMNRLASPPNSIHADLDVAMRDTRHESGDISQIGN